MTSHSLRLAHRPDPSGRLRRGALSRLIMVTILTAGWSQTPATTTSPATEDGPRRWKDAELVESYGHLVSTGGLEAAARAPVLPGEPLQAGFMEALAWYAAGTPRQSGVLTLAGLDERIDVDVEAYLRLLKARVETGERNEYSRTRLWKVIQKLTVLRDEMRKPPRNGHYPFTAKSRRAPVADAWETEHTIDSPDEFSEKVCRASYHRPVLVKYGNTNCTQCMLFEMIGSVRELAENPAFTGVDVYKLWFGHEPDESFAGMIRRPRRLDDLALEEGISNSPTFVVYRSGRPMICGDAFPDDAGRDAKLESCVKNEPGSETPPAGFCAKTGSP